MFRDEHVNRMMNDMVRFVSTPAAFMGMTFDCYMRMMTQQYWREIFATRYHPSHYEHEVHAQIEIPEEMVEGDMEAKLFV